MLHKSCIGFESGGISRSPSQLLNSDMKSNHTEKYMEKVARIEKSYALELDLYIHLIVHH